jgi:hypothetical protein
VRQIYPVVATVTATGYERVSDDEVAERFGSLVERRAIGRGIAGGGP